MVSTVAVFAKTVTQKILVKGQCGMCKEKIETALDISGISFAEWNKESKMLTVRYNDNKVSEDQIHTIISKLGYATDKVAADPTSEAALDMCCQPKPAPVKKACCNKPTKACSKKSPACEKKETKAACGAKKAGCCSKKK